MYAKAGDMVLLFVLASLDVFDSTLLPAASIVRRQEAAALRRALRLTSLG